MTTATAVKPLFPMGMIVMTPGALDAFRNSRFNDNPATYLERHQQLDPGILSKDDIAENALSLREGLRIFSAYRLKDQTKIWIVTESDRSSTCILLPSEY